MSEQQILSESGYSDTAIDYYINKPYFGDMTNANHVSEMTGTCGDTMKIFLKIENNVILDAKYQVLGCPGAVASAMAVVDLVKMKNIDFAKSLTDGDVFTKLEDIPDKKHHCIQLSVKTLHKAIDEYAIKT